MDGISTYRVYWNSVFFIVILFYSEITDVTTQTTGCARPPSSPGVLQFVDGSELELNETREQFFDVGTTLTPVCADPGQQRLTMFSTVRACQIFRQWSGPEPLCEPVAEQIVLNGDYSHRQILSDSSISITLSRTTSYVEVLCLVAEGTPKLSSSHIDIDGDRVENFSRRVDHATMGRPNAKGIDLRPPLLSDSGTFGCRSVQKGVKQDHQVVIHFQQSSSEFAGDCPNNITVSTEPEENFAHVYWTIPTVPDGYTQISDHNPGDEFEIGSVQVHYYLARDSSSDHILACEFKVTVLDEEKPHIIYCPEDITQSVPPGQSSADVSWTAPDAWDNCDVVSFKPDTGSTEGTFHIGRHDMVYEVSDCSGNLAYCNFTILIRDNEPPVITNCPSNITINVTDPTLHDVIVTWIEPNITDNSGDFGINSSSVPGESFGFGVTLVSYEAKDSSDNEEYCDFFITINDDVAPWFINCPNDTTKYTARYGAVVYWDEPTATDNIGIVEPVQRSHLPGDYFQEGVHHIQNVVQDSAGNKGICEFNITVAIAICPSIQTNISGWTLSWENTPIHRIAPSLERCSVYTTNAGLPIANRECELDESIQGARWLEPEIVSCGEGRDTVDILDLMLITVVESNVEEVAEATADVTFNTTQLENDAIESVATTLENIADVQSNSAEVTQAVVKTIDNVLNGAEEEELDDDDALAASKIIKSLEKQVTTTQSSQGNFEATEPRVAVRTVAIESNEISRDITFVSFRDEVVADANGFLQVNQIETVIDDNDLRNVDTSIRLPKEVKERANGLSNRPDSNVHFSFILFQSDRLFKSKRLQAMRESNRNVSTSGRVISAAVEGPTVANLTQPVVIEFSPHQAWNESTGKAECVYWDFTLEDGVGDWSDKGCYYTGTIDDRVVCHCYHLTSFAVLMDMTGNGSEGVQGFVLDFITKLGCVLSIAGLVLSLATLLALRSLRSSRSRQILIQLCFSLLFLYVVFLGGIEATGNGTVCLIIAALLHYFTLTTLAWMAVEARNMYLLLVRVFKGTESKFMLKACLFAWGLPTIIVIICVALTIDEYKSESHCFLRPGYPLYYGLMLPIGLILIHNFITFGLVVKSLLPSNMGSKCASTMEKKGRSEQIISRLQNALVMSVLLGLTWVFGFLAIDEATFLFQLLFCIFNSIQGLLVFILFCLRSQDVRKAWKTYFPFECNIHGQSYKVKESSYGYHLRGSDAHAWHGPMALGPEDGQGLEYYMYTDRPTSNGADIRYAYTSQFSSNSTANTYASQLSCNSTEIQE
ncbi:uncharacterized protein [Amphiura filiformis]|uniref:uncharacterized protein n=1 Tax=Amphiura filiformis TaxID=82378 RepID=UPI003B21FB95